jgi:hypothetical protein
MRDDHSSAEDFATNAPDMSIVPRNRTPAPEFPLDVLGSASDWECARELRRTRPSRSRGRVHWAEAPCVSMGWLGRAKHLMGCTCWRTQPGQKLILGAKAGMKAKARPRTRAVKAPLVA